METDPDVKRDWVAGIVEEQMPNSMRKAPSKENRNNYGKDAKAMSTIAESKINRLRLTDIDRIYEKRNSCGSPSSTRGNPCPHAIKQR